MSAATEHKMTATEYLAFEDAQRDARHEFVDGETFAMSGGTLAHNAVSFNIAVALRAHVRTGAGDYRHYGMDVRLRVEAADTYFYPDAFVSCDDADDPRAKAKHDAVLVVEVLSDSTEAYDRGDKFASYRKLPGLREYGLIDPRRRRVEVFARESSGTWRLTPIEGDGVVRLTSIGLDVPMAAIYEDVGIDGA